MQPGKLTLPSMRQEIVKKNLTTSITALTLLGALAIPSGLAAQNKPDHKRFHHYKLAAIGTFGGPNVSLAVEPIAQILNNRGVAVGEAETSIPNPYYPNGNPFVGGGAYIGHSFSWQHTVLTDLGTLPGGSNSGAVWINNAGVVAGISENGEIDPLLGFPEGIAVLWKDGKIISLGTLDGGYESVANAVNDWDQVAGPALNTIPDPYSILGLGTQTRAFLWENGVMRDLGTLGGPDAFAIYINDLGQIAGSSYVNSTPNPVLDACGSYSLNVPTEDPFIWENNKMIDLGTLGGTCGFANGLNMRGEVVGQSDLAGDQTFHPFLWKRGKITDLGTLGGNFGAANWLNDAGEIVGDATLPGDLVPHGFLWREGTMTDLGALQDFPCSDANAINVSRQIVGAANDCVQFEHAFLWQDGHMIDLNVFVPPGSGVVLEEADFINDRGEIIGYASLANGDEHGFLLIPCDENHSGLDGCDYSLMDAAVTRESPAPVMHEPTTTSPRPPALGGLRNNVRGMSRFRLGPLSRIPRPIPGAVLGPATPLSQNSDRQQDDEIAIHDRAALVVGFSSNVDECPKVGCSPHYTKIRLCGVAPCDEHIEPIVYTAYDQVYHRTCRAELKCMPD
jgi:probable HAF family extracellular repeat protein